MTRWRHSSAVVPTSDAAHAPLDRDREPGAPGAARASQDARRFGRDVHGRCSAFRDVKARRPCSRMARARLYTTDRDFSRFAALRTMNALDETRSRRERLFTRSRLHCTKSGEGGIRTPGGRSLTRFRVVPFQPGSRTSPWCRRRADECVLLPWMRIDAKSARAPRRDETFAGVERCSRSSATRGGATAVAERLRFRR